MAVVFEEQQALNLLAAASHDLRQPVQALGLSVAALHAASQGGDLDARRVDEICSHMRASLRGLGRTLDTLLSLTLPPAGTQQVTLRPVCLQEALQALADEFQVIAKDRKLEMRMARTGLWAHSDPHLLHQILSNLLGNALRYTISGKVLVGCRRRGLQVEVQVWDTGIGIPQDAQAHVFEERYRASNAGAVREASSGLGLGLAIVRRSASLTGASLGLWSEPGRGSMFSVHLPVCEPPARQARRR